MEQNTQPQTNPIISTNPEMTPTSEVKTEVVPLEQVQAAPQPKSRKWKFIILSAVVVLLAIGATLLFIRLTAPKLDMRNPESAAKNLQQQLLTIFKPLSEGKFTDLAINQGMYANKNIKLNIEIPEVIIGKGSRVSLSLNVNNDTQNPSLEMNISGSLPRGRSSILKDEIDISLAGNNSLIFIKIDKIPTTSNSFLRQASLQRGVWNKITIDQALVSELLAFSANPEASLQTSLAAQGTSLEEATRIYKSLVVYLEQKQLLENGVFVGEKMVFGRTTYCATYEIIIAIASATPLPIKICSDLEAEVAAISILNPTKKAEELAVIEIGMLPLSAITLPADAREAKELTKIVNDALKQTLDSIKKQSN